MDLPYRSARSATLRPLGGVASALPPPFHFGSSVLSRPRPRPRPLPAPAPIPPLPLPRPHRRWRRRRRFSSPLLPISHSSLSRSHFNSVSSYSLSWPSSRHHHFCHRRHLHRCCRRRRRWRSRSSLFPLMEAHRTHYRFPSLYPPSAIGPRVVVAPISVRRHRRVRRCAHSHHGLSLIRALLPLFIVAYPCQPYAPFASSSSARTVPTLSTPSTPAGPSYALRVALSRI